MKVTYTGPTKSARSVGTVLIHGQAVKIMRLHPETMTADVRYDPRDQRHNDCAWSTLTTINGVPAGQLLVEAEVNP